MDVLDPIRDTPLELKIKALKKDLALQEQAVLAELSQLAPKDQIPTIEVLPDYQLERLTSDAHIKYWRARDDRVVIERFYAIKKVLQDIIAPYTTDLERFPLVKKWLLGALEDLNIQEEAWPYELFDNGHDSGLYEYLLNIEKAQADRNDDFELLPRQRRHDKFFNGREDRNYHHIKADVPEGAVYVTVKHVRTVQLMKVLKTKDSRQVQHQVKLEWYQNVAEQLENTAEKYFSTLDAFYIMHDKVWLFAHDTHSRLPNSEDFVAGLREAADHALVASRPPSHHSHVSRSLAHRVGRRQGPPEYAVLQDSDTPRRRHFA
ncbi:hypothetical protein JCM11491_004278 [Sporobolomyces phaffii]